jgi:hypothetical protein
MLTNRFNQSKPKPSPTLKPRRTTRREKDKSIGKKLEAVSKLLLLREPAEFYPTRQMGEIAAGVAKAASRTNFALTTKSVKNFYS